MTRLHWKLLGALAALVVTVVALTGILAERSLRLRERERIEASLGERTRLVRELVADLPLDTTPSDQLAPLVHQAAAHAGARVTLLASDGRVVADSELTLAGLARVENHGARPEVREALAGRVGVSSRRSGTVGRPLLYMAVPAPAGGAVRLAVDLAQIEALAAELRRELLVAAVIGLAAALALSALLAWLTLRRVELLRQAVAAIAGGDLERRLRWGTGDELNEIAGAIDAMAEQLGLRLAEAEAEKDRLGAVLASMVEGVLVLGPEGRVALATPRLQEQLSAWGDVAGRTVLELVRHAELADALGEAAESPTPVVREFAVGDKGERHLLMNAARFPATGPRAGTVAVFHDVSEVRRLEEVRRDFIANASHELRTPLTAIRGFADTLLSAELQPDELKSYLEVIVRNSERLQNLMDDLLELSRIESRKVPLHPTEVDVGRLARMLVLDLGPRLEEAQLRAEVVEENPPPAYADRRAVEQVLSNLLDNAVKYSDPQGEIRVTITGQDRLVSVEVADTGIGIPEAAQQRIFERFYRVDVARSRALGGTGLGLAIVKHLVQASGGHLSVQSHEGRGSRFRFTLPRSDAGRSRSTSSP
ncbi:MAG: ATP-binding protein [Proteobacteria bacterium]|nr:ATP-binding protein [Pseudomonadota bacterium]